MAKDGQRCSLLSENSSLLLKLSDAQSHLSFTTLPGWSKMTQLGFGEAKQFTKGTSLEVQWLRLCASIAGGTVSIPGWGTEIPHAVWCGPKK